MPPQKSSPSADADGLFPCQDGITAAKAPLCRSVYAILAKNRLTVKEKSPIGEAVVLLYDIRSFRNTRDNMFTSEHGDFSYILAMPCLFASAPTTAATAFEPLSSNASGMLDPVLHDVPISKVHVRLVVRFYGGHNQNSNVK